MTMSVELMPSAGGKDCPANGEHPDIECQCDECDYMMLCYPPDEPMDERLRRVVYGNPAVGRNALEFIDSFLTPEEIAESDRRVKAMLD